MNELLRSTSFKIMDKSTRFFFVSILLVLFYKLILELMYVTVYPAYSYTGIELLVNRNKILESYLIILFFSCFIVSRDIKPSIVSLQLLFLFFIVPFFSYYGLADEDRSFTYGVFISFLLTIIIAKYFPMIKISRYRVSPRLIILILLIVSFLAVCLSLYYNGIPTFRALNLQSVYDVRDEYRGGRFFEYIESWIAYSIVPFLIGLSLHNRNYRLFGYALGINLFLYLNSGIKYMLFATLIAILMSVGIRKKAVLISLLLFLISCVVVVYCFDELSETATFSHMLLIRPLISPAWNTYLYHLFFSQNPLLYFSENLTILSNPYNQPSAVMVGDYFFGGQGGSWLTASYLANGYANLGFFGVLLFGILLGLVVKLADLIYVRTKNVGLCISFAISLNLVIHTSLFTALASRGILCTLLVGWLYWKADLPLKKWSLKLSPIS
jgi:hypothetical protein